MNIPTINNHLRKKIILLGDTNDLSEGYNDLLQQGVFVEYVCNITGDRINNNVRSITISECKNICHNDSSTMVLCISKGYNKEIQKLRNSGIAAYSLEDFEELFYSNSSPRACYLEELYIDRNGDVHCCCKTYLNNIIGNIAEPNIIDKIRKFVPKKECRCSRGILTSVNSVDSVDKCTVKMASIELSSRCNAKCLYCFQQGPDRNAPYQYYGQLFELIESLDIHKLMFAGGELLIQPDSLNFIEKLRLKHPDYWMHLKTNGFCDEGKKPRVTELFDSTTVTLNGFSESTYRAIMDIPFNPVKQFCESISNEQILLGLKYLCSPANVTELPYFLEWAISLHPDRIIVPCARLYSCKPDVPNEWKGSSFDKLNMAYWKEIFKRTGVACRQLIDNKERTKGTSFDFDSEIISILELEGGDNVG